VKAVDPALREQARATAGGGDPRACRDAAQQLRRAGAVMPAPLLALSALKPDLLGTAGAPAAGAPAAPGAAPPPAAPPPPR
jgi:hypothetical protein